MTFWILPISCIPTPRSTIITIRTSEQNDNQVQSILTSFDNTIHSKLGNPRKFLIKHKSPLDEMNEYIGNFADSSKSRNISATNTESDLREGDISSLLFELTSEESAMEEVDEYIGAQVPLKSKNGPVLVRIISRKRDGSGALIGTHNDISILDTRVYKVKFSDRHDVQYATNFLAESLTSSYDCDGDDKKPILEICGYCKDSKGIDRSNVFYTSNNVNKIPIVTTKGWEVRLRWNDNSTTWVPLLLVKSRAPLHWGRRTPICNVI